jgi:D-inositol-3-phosphate glycosyltransferase
VRKQLLFFGIVRPYKGLDILLHALKDLPGVKLTVVGEFWNLEKYQKMIVKLQLSDRVILKTGYLANTELAELFAGIDALVLPYKAGSATSIPELAYHFERPVIATTASSLAQNVHDGVDGLLCAPNDSTALRLAIATFYEPGVAKKLQQGVTSPQTTTAWQKYSRSLLTK